MTDPHADTTREVVAAFSDRNGFESAVDRLLAAGFDRTDLSVLASHDSLEITGDVAGYRPGEPGAVAAGVAGEFGILSSLGIAGLLLLTAGPVGVAAAGIVGAAAGMVALRPLFDQLTEGRHAEDFTAMVEAGHILLWVRTAEAITVERAERILLAAGGSGLRRLDRPETERTEE